MIPITRTRPQIFLLCILSLALGFLTHGDSATRAVQVTDKSNEFKVMIGRRVRELDAAGKIHSNGLYPCDVTDLVLPFIPIGTTFDDAEAFLRRAGFSISPRQENPNIEGFYAVRATYDISHGMLFGRTSISILLSPEKAAVFDRVNRVSAAVRRVSF